MILIDANALIVLLIGTIDPKLLSTHKTTSIYEEQDFYDLLAVIGDLRNLVVLPNVWTEVDNLLNNFSGNYKFPYIEAITNTIANTTEKYIQAIEATRSYEFFELGLTDSLLLIHARNCKLLITSDSKLSDYATAYGLAVFDLVQNRNKRI